MPTICCSVRIAKVSEAGLLGLSEKVAQVIQTDPYLMAGSQWASHMLEQDGEQVLTDHLGIEGGQGPLAGFWDRQGSKEEGWLHLHLPDTGRKG